MIPQVIPRTYTLVVLKLLMPTFLVGVLCTRTYTLVVLKSIIAYHKACFKNSNLYIGCIEIRKRW